MLASELVLCLERWLGFRGNFLVCDFTGILMRWKAALENQITVLEFILKETAIPKLLIRITICQSFQMRDTPRKDC